MTILSLVREEEENLKDLDGSSEGDDLEDGLKSSGGGGGLKTVGSGGNSSLVSITSGSGKSIASLESMGSVCILQSISSRSTELYAG